MRLVVRMVSIVLLVGVASGAGYQPHEGARADYEPQVTNGHDAEPNAWPFMVGLLLADTPDDFAAQFCGGSLVAASWVLTAAHCVDGASGPVAPSDLDILVGGHDLRAGDGTRVRADHIIVHEGYDAQTNVDDLALVHLSTPQASSPIALAADDSLDAAGTQATLLGWGGTSANQEDQAYATVLQEASMPVVDDGACAAQLDGFVAASMLCAGAPEDDADGGVDACQGDSGGPLFADRAGEPVQIGIVSFGPTCGHTYTAYTQVSAFVGWIGDAIRELPSGVERVAGVDRYATAAALARDRVTAPANVVFLVTGAAFADALAVAPLAARDAGAVLLTGRDALPSATADALRDLDPERVEIIGGPGAVSDAVADQVEAVTGGPVSRTAGVDRFATAAALAGRLVPDALPATFPSVFVASGTAFADALGGAAAAADRGVPLLLTSALELPETTAAELRRLAPESVLLLGGEVAVSEAVADAIRSLGIGVERVAGADRYATSARIATRVFDSGADAVAVATGLTFPDALVAGAFAEPILLLPAPNAVPEDVRVAVSTLGAARITVLGGFGSVSDAQARVLADARP